MGWLTGWDYRKSHLILQKVGAGADYQVGIKVYYGSGIDGTETINGTTFGKIYCNSHSQTDFDDIRFTKDDGTTELPYWLEEKTDSNYAIFWVKLTENLDNGNVTIYVYYGNSGASATGNGANTFIHFDDFEDGTVGQLPSGWSESENPANGSTLVTASGYRGKGVEIICTAATYRGTRAISLSGSYCVELRWKTPGNAEFVLMGGATYQYHLAHRRAGIPTQFQYLRLTDIWVNSGINEDANWHKSKYFVKEASDTFVLYIDSTSLSGSIYGTDNYSSQWGGRFQETGSIVLDDMFARKYVDPEPAHGTWGG